ncbi:hypothetical protein BH11PLA2_BH11PLA2_39690 [soil metagenome]
MTTRTYRTSLRCQGCVETLRPLLNAVPGIASWSADVSGPQKLLRIESDSLKQSDVVKLLAPAGYEVLGEVLAPVTAVTAAEPPRSYYPLLLIFAYIAGATAVYEWQAGSFVLMRAMANFMAGFFLTFSFFKLLDFRGFANSYAMYDLLAARSRIYAFVYPFLELGLGLAYLGHVAPVVVNVFTLILMLLGIAGVFRSMARKQKVRCACLGAVINLPVSVVTLTEDLLMAVMAATMLLIRD